MDLFIRVKVDKEENKLTIEGQSTYPTDLTNNLLNKARSENDTLAVKKHSNGGMSILGNNTNYDIIPKNDFAEGMGYTTPDSELSKLEEEED